MYYPYLKGRQYELLALKELVENELITPLIIPIIEPLKASTTLCNTLQAFADTDRTVISVWYPTSNDFHKDLDKVRKDEDSKEIAQRVIDIINDPRVNKGIEVTERSPEIVTQWEGKSFSRDKWTVICNNYDMLDVYDSLYVDVHPQYVIIPDDSAFRRRVRRNRNKIVIDDKFQKQIRNVDYIDNIDEFFSDDHLYFSEEGFKGFSDYSIVGNYETTSGFAPKAVAIHIVYLDKKDNTLRIHHFVSDSNEDIQNTAKKFYEAVAKLVAWCAAETPEMTYGLKEFINHYEKGTYPGLGVVKKLSIMHHLELMSNHLTEDGWN
jgi:hypothetical protein